MEGIHFLGKTPKVHQNTDPAKYLKGTRPFYEPLYITPTAMTFNFLKKSIHSFAVR